VGGLAGELEGGPRDAEQVLVQERAVEAVDHHGRVHVLEEPRLDELDLASAPFFGGRADDVDAPLGAGPHRGQGRPGSRPRGRDDVVPARVPDAGQRVVLAENGDGRPFSRLDGGAERRLHPARPRVDFEALLGEELREPGARLDLW
jgi:hypothetical protein